MPNPFRDLLFGRPSGSDLVEIVTPRRTFADVILPEETRQALNHALTQIEKHDLLYERWGLAERHATGLGLAFNFAGPPGTGKTICAEAVAQVLDRPLMVTRYAEMESAWAGETSKNVAAVFRYAKRENAVLFFDEADALAGRRFTNVHHGYQREANAVINVMLRELEAFAGVVIFATNLATNLDPAFERRIRTHILFKKPDAAARIAIWKAQLHDKTPLAADVDFEVLARRYEATGGDIKNAVLKAAQMAVAEPGPDSEKRIHQRHFEHGMQEVLAARSVMDQSLFAPGDGLSMPGELGALWQAFAQDQEALQTRVEHLADQLDAMRDNRKALVHGIEALHDDQQALVQQLEALQADLSAQPAHFRELLAAAQEATEQHIGAAEAQWAQRLHRLQYLAVVALLGAVLALVLAALL